MASFIRKLCLVIVIFAIIKAREALSSRLRRNTFREEAIDSCGVRKIPPGLKNFGDIRRGEFPWIVALMHKRSGPPDYVCGGTLISSTVVISGE